MRVLKTEADVLEFCYGRKSSSASVPAPAPAPVVESKPDVIVTSPVAPSPSDEKEVETSKSAGVPPVSDSVDSEAELDDEGFDDDLSDEDSDEDEDGDVQEDDEALNERVEKLKSEHSARDLQKLAESMGLDVAGNKTEVATAIARFQLTTK